MGNLIAYSFMKGKTFILGEGGTLVINDQRFEKRADVICKKAPNRKVFFNGDVDKIWVGGFWPFFSAF